VHGETFIKSGDIYKALDHFGVNPTLDAALNERYLKCQIKTAAMCLPRDNAYLILTGSHAQACVNGLMFDQNTSESGDEAQAFWGRKKKVSLIITVDRLPETKTEEPTPMTDTIPATLPEASIFGLAAVAVAEYEAAFQTVNGEAKGLRTEANVSKIDAYAALINALTVNKIKKGSKRAGEFRAALEEAGVSAACAKRYMEIGQAAAKLPMMKDTETVGNVGHVLQENDIKTEAALKAVCFPVVEKSIVEKLVEAAKAGTDTDDEALQALLDAAAAINPAAQDVANTLVAAINRKVAA
jgi:hypothetical protein